MSSSLPLLRTTDSAVLTVARLGLAVVILPHGLQKTLGWFGGFGFPGTMDFFTQTMGFPWLLGLAAVVAESVGALLLLVGLGSRIWAGLIGITMFGAMVTVHLEHGFFMNWFGTQSGEGIEFFILAIALSAALVIGGGGALSLDRWLQNGRRAVRHAPSVASTGADGDRGVTQVAA